MITDKKIVLTGANSGIGLETLKLLVEGNNTILAVDLHTDKIAQFDSKKVIPMICDVSTAENVDKIFDEAVKVLGDIDIFYANAGFPYFEKMDYVNWARVDKMFAVNVYSPIYSYQKFVAYKNGKPGHFAITVSAIGKMAMPGYALYSASKFAMQGFQQGIRLEMPENIKLTCLYPIATDTGFFVAGAEGSGKIITEKPFPVQKPSHVAKCMVKGIEKGKKTVNPSALFSIGMVLMAICPPIRTIYWKLEKGKLDRFLAQKAAK